jgi:hypothetical protein
VFKNEVFEALIMECRKRMAGAAIFREEVTVHRKQLSMFQNIHVEKGKQCTPRKQYGH